MDIYKVRQERDHASVTSTEVYAKFILRRLEMDFTSLVNTDNNGDFSKMGHGLVEHTSSDILVNQTIQGGIQS